MSRGSNTILWSEFRLSIELIPSAETAGEARPEKELLWFDNSGLEADGDIVPSPAPPAGTLRRCSPEDIL